MKRTVTSALTAIVGVCFAMQVAAQGQVSTLKGRGYAAYIDVPGIATTTYYCDTGWLPPQGGPAAESATDVQIPGVLTATLMDVVSDDDGFAGVGQTRVTIQNAVILPGHSAEIAFAFISSDDDDSECDEEDDSPSSSIITNLTVGGLPVQVTGQINQTLVLPNIGVLKINEQTSPDEDEDDCEQDDDDDIVINALHLILNSGGEIIVGSSYFHFDDECCVVAIEKETWSHFKRLFR